MSVNIEGYADIVFSTPDYSGTFFSNEQLFVIDFRRTDE